MSFTSSLMQQLPCKWRNCNAVMNSVDNLSRHLVQHAQDKPVPVGHALLSSSCVITPLHRDHSCVSGKTAYVGSCKREVYFLMWRAMLGRHYHALSKVYALFRLLMFNSHATALR